MNPLMPIWMLGIGKAIGLLYVLIRGRFEKKCESPLTEHVLFYPREYIQELARNR